MALALLCAVVCGPWGVAAESAPEPQAPLLPGISPAAVPAGPALLPPVFDDIPHPRPMPLPDPDPDDPVLLIHQIQDPAVETVDEMTRTPPRGSGRTVDPGVESLDQNNNMHFVMRLNSPWKMPNGQIMEAGVQAYTGNYVPTLAPININGTNYTPKVVSPSNGVLDQRIAATFVYYPQRLGVTAEWNVGLGPQLGNLANVSSTNPPTISSQPLSGGYVLVNYKADTDRFGRLFPYFRWQTGRGGYLWERNSPFAYLGEFDLGLEWQFTPQMELTCEYD